MRVAVIMFVYRGSTYILPKAVEYLRSTFPKSYELEIVLVNDKSYPVSKAVLDGLNCMVLETDTPRHGNLRSYQWVRRQVLLFQELVDAGFEVIVKLDPDTVVCGWGQFLAPHQDGWRGMVGMAGKYASGGVNPNVAIGACYSVHKDCVVAMVKEMEELWNAGWMDQIMRYLGLFSPGLLKHIPVHEDMVISLWASGKGLLRPLCSETYKAYDWNSPAVTPANGVLLLGNPGPPGKLSLEEVADRIGEVMQKTISNPPQPG